jgi:DNA gyrase/topoisomerase IV subunit B
MRSKSLRCGRVVIVTDGDRDGSRVEGPPMNFFRAFLPSLLRKEFLCCLAALCLSLRVAVSVGRESARKQRVLPQGLMYN